MNADPAARDRLKVAFLADYRVSLAEQIVPAAELSEQISHRGHRGVGDREHEVRPERRADHRHPRRRQRRDARGGRRRQHLHLRPHRRPRSRRGGRTTIRGTIYRNDPELARALDTIGGGAFSPGEPDLFRPIVDSLLDGGDRFLLLADYASYVACQARVASTYRDEAAWTTKSILNVASMGKFSSDRTIRQYADEIWHVAPTRVE